MNGYTGKWISKRMDSVAVVGRWMDGELVNSWMDKGVGAWMEGGAMIDECMHGWRDRR